MVSYAKMTDAEIEKYREKSLKESDQKQLYRMLYGLSERAASGDPSDTGANVYA